MITELISPSIHEHEKNYVGIILFCRFGHRYLVTKPADVSEDALLGMPLRELWTNTIYGEQFIANLHDWKNDQYIIEQLFAYAVEDKFLQANYNRQQMIEYIALQLQQRQLLIYFLENTQPLFSNKHEMVQQSTPSIILNEGAKLYKVTDEEESSSEVPERQVEEKSRLPHVDPFTANFEIKKALTKVINKLETKKAQLAAWDSNTQRAFKQWFGTTDAKSVKIITEKVDKSLAFAKNLTLDNFVAAEADADQPGLVGYVYREDESKIYLGSEFRYLADDGYESKAGALAHEISHFTSNGRTEDYEYLQVPCLTLAKDTPNLALNNADSFMYFIEGK